jgi:surface protein
MSFTTLISSFKTFFFYAIVFFSVVVSAQAQTGLVANWKFDEGTGTSVADDSGNNLTGTFSTTGNGSLTWGSSTAFIGAASALTFEGTNSDYAYVNVPDNSMLFNSMNAKMTIEAWIYQSDNADNTIIDRGNYSFLLQANGTGNANPGLKFYNPAIGWIYSSTALPVNEWVHVSMTWDDSSDTLIFYKNGVETDTFTGLESLISTAGPVNIGRQDPNDCHCNLMNGKIDELRLWNVVRSQAEISANMNSTLAPVISSFTPTSAGIGATITLTGTNFTGTTAVSFGGTAASSFTVVSSTSITAVLASGSSGSISVTSNNSTATKTGFTYLSSNTDLSALSISDGSLSPNFASGTTAYTANVNNATTSITVTPTQADVNASITVNGIPVVSGAASSAIALNIGSNTITTIVTAQNGATKTYTLTVTREMTPPGNALNFDGSNDYVNVGDVIEGFTTITFEAWVNHSTSGNWDEICSKAYVNSFGITGDDRLWFHLGNGAAWFAGGGVASNSTIPSNKWTHVAATWDGTTAKLYINGVLDNTAAHTGTVGSNSNLRGIGGYVWEISLFSGKIDELRIYDSVLSQSAIAADMVSTSVTSANLIGYYNFDTISGNILIDKSTSNFNGTVINGPTLVESYAMVVPITTAATSISTTGFTANWSAPTIGTVTNYILDVATDIGFTAPVSGSPFNIAAPTLTKHITGLASGSAYFYRVRADKTSVSGEGASSGIISESTAAAVLSPFVTTWQTDGSNNTTIPLTGSGYDFNVDWGDGTVETKTGSPGNISHTYTSSGIKTVSITPNTPTGFPRIYVNNFSLRNNLMTIESWGSGQWGTSVDRAFYGASNLEVNATDTPDFSATTNFQIMFYNCTTVTGTNGFANWTLNTNPAASVSFSNMFNGATQFDGVISNWDVSRVTTFENMFSNAQKFNQDISSWNVANVTNMSSMFYNAKVFAQDISSWNVGNVTNMSYMFRNADAFNFNISGWDVSSVTNMTYMFDGNNVFNQDLSNWDVSNVTNMLGMFREMPVFNAPLVWGTKTGNVTTMREMFRGSPQFNQDINGWDVSKVTTTYFMFYAATAFNQPLNSWNVSNLVNAGYMFVSATSFNQNISSWDISKVTNLQNFLVNGKLSRTNYDALLLGWSTLDAGETLVPINLNAHFGNSKYSDTPTVLTARNTTLIANKAWTITDGGTDADIVLPEIASTSLASDNTNISITFSENVYLTDVASAALETTSFLFSISGGTATLNTTTPSSISTSDNLTFVLDIDMSGAPDGTEMLTVTPVLNGIFDVSGNAASATQINNSAQLNDLSGPVITGPSSETGLNSAISSNENINAVYTFSVNETVTWSLGTSSDGALFSIDGSGSLVFTNAPDYEIPSSSLNSNTYTVEIIATDIANNISTQILTVTITDVLSATLTNFSNEAKHYFDASYTIAPPISNSSGLLTYTSSDLAVAIISGSTVTITGAGTAIITATQAMDATYDSGSLTSVLTVTAISVLTKNGGISTTNPNYVNKNGGIGKGIALSRNGTILAVKTPPPAIGDLREGGVVFWVDGNGGGLVCALEDQSTAIKWGTNGIETGAEATSIGSGAANTAAIISVQGGDQSSYVAGISNTYDGGGYKDWFLPSEDEVKEMYLNRVAVNNTLEQRGAVLVGGSIQQYWTSTQSSGNNNWAVGFSFIGGTMSNFNKSDTRPSMRAVRAF